ncbi:MAG: hypothetical protein Q9226_003467 [Calogaya cf. arnoldii]
MDHIPYPVSTSVPPVHIPLLVLDTVRGSGVPFTGLEKAEDPDGTPTEAKCTTSGDNSVGIAPEANFGSLTDWTLDYWDYPQKQGWVVDDSSSWWTSNAEEDARRAQEWMYFELLHVFLGQPVDPSSLARKEEGSEKILLDSSLVPELLTRWLARQHASQQDTQDYIGTIIEGPRKESRVLSLLARVALECNKLDDLPEPSQSTALAIRVLVETLSNAIYNLARVEATETRDIRKLENNSLLKQRFLSNDWCPFQVARLWGQYSPSTTYYLSSLSREPTFGGVQHNLCEESRCMTTSIDPATYQHRHVESCSTDSDTCQMVGVQSSTVAACINRGNIPLIKFEESDDGFLRPSVIESNNDLRYVALSHVWSGGLGNVNANSMFSCQLRKLHSLLQTIRENGDDDLDRDRGSKKTRGMKRDLRASLRMKPLPQQPVLLWIDTLCVPVGVDPQTYKKAITQMAQIYVQAQCVLVVDPELQKMKYENLPDEELFASVQCSAWNSRSWTFQEAAMARVFYVQFLDGYSIIDKKWHDFMKGMDRGTASDTTTSQVGTGTIDMRESLMMDVSSWFGTMPVMTKIRSYDPRTLMTGSEDWKNFVRVWNGLRTRSTTKSDDLYGIIAIMVDLTAYEILQLDPQERMKAILRSQSTLPISLLYQDCPKVLDSGGHAMWAPRQIAGGRLDMNSGYMTLHDDGLYIDVKQERVARYSWPQVYGFPYELALPASFTLRLANPSRIMSVRLCLGGDLQPTGSTGSWIILVNETASYSDITQTFQGTLLRRTVNNGSTILAAYNCPVEVTIEAVTEAVEGDTKSSLRASPDQSIRAESISLEKHVVKIETGTLQGTLTGASGAHLGIH